MSKHTPGPWHVTAFARSIHVSTASGHTVASVSVPASTIPAVKARKAADMRLISAAPDMLEALEKIAALAEPPDRNLAGLKLDEIDFIARAAIAKAKGEANG